jgi:hypothetical protein
MSLFPDPSDAARRIDEWFRRGYVLFSDRFTKSTHLRAVDDRLRAERPGMG